MKYLLDTNILILIIEQNFDLISKNQLDILVNNSDNLYVSEASYYEMSIKIRLNKLKLKNINFEDIDQARKKLKIKLLKSKTAHYINIHKIEQVEYNGKTHSDPFDLLIISQSVSEKMTIISTDRVFPYYKIAKVIS